MIIKDDFLTMEEFDQLDSIINNPFFPWFYQTVQTWDDDPFFCHTLYHADEPQSEFYRPVQTIFKKYMKWTSMYRLNVNFCTKGSTSNFHTDTNGKDNEEVMTTSIFYLNTNNGYTEFEDGSTVDSVQNRLVTFPTNTSHKVVGQTDTDKRIVLNFNYIK